MQFRDRSEAGRLLARQLEHYKNRPETLVLGLPRGGVPVAYEVAKAINAPLDVFIVRKLGVPGHEELGMGAIATGGARIINNEVVQMLGIPPNAIESVTAREQEELARRERLYRGERPAPNIRGRIVILVDDGLATGSTMRVALAAVRQQAPARLVVAVPTAPHETCVALRNDADEVVCASTPEPFYAVGGAYRSFEQTSDDEVRDLINRAA